MLITLFWLLVQAVFVLAVVRYAAFLFSNLRAGQLPVIRERAGSLFRPMARGVVTAMLADGLAAFNSLFLLAREKSGSGPGAPVIMIHGLYHNRTAWRIMRRRLVRAGFTNLHTYQYNSFTRDFEPAVHGLLRKIDSLTGDTDAGVVLVGHSLGGMVARCAAGNPAYRGRVAGLLTLGSPHHGSELALLGPNRMARDLLPGGHIPRSVERMPDPDCPRLSVHTTTDDYVFPLPMLIPGRPGWTEAVCSPMAHVWMLYSREVASTVSTFLESLSGSR